MTYRNTAWERIFLCRAFDATYQMDTGIDPGGAYIVLEHNRAAFTGANSSSVHIAPESFSCKRPVKFVFASQLFRHSSHHKIIARHRYQVIHFIAPVNIHYLGYWA